MNLLLLPNQSPKLYQDPIAEKLGLNEALVLQQLHYLLQKSSIPCDGHNWFFHTFQQWQKQFPFWSERTIIRIITKLEQEGYIISSKVYNKFKLDKTKWYRIDYERFYHDFNCQLDNMELKHGQKCSCHDDKLLLQVLQNPFCKSDNQDFDNPSVTITKELRKDIKKEKEKEKEKENPIVEKHLDTLHEIIEYLNAKTGKTFSAESKSTKKLIVGYLNMGYTMDDFKHVIDQKVKQWLYDPKMNMYLRPNTLFSPTNFENYLNESMQQQKQQSRSKYPIELDYSEGEDEDWLPLEISKVL